MVNAVERNKSGRWEGHLWTGRRGGKEEGERRRGVGGREKGGGKEGRRERVKGGNLRTVVSHLVLPSMAVSN